MDDASKLDSGEPGWESQEDWAKGEIRYFDENIGAIVMWLGGTVLLLGLVPLVIGLVIWVRTRTFDLFWVLSSIIPVCVGSGFLHIGLRKRTRWQRYGDSVFYMSDVPGVIGGSIAGVVQTGKHVESPEGFRVGLCCVEIKRGDSDGSHFLWDAERIVRSNLQSRERSGTSIPVMFAIPFDVLESNTQTNQGKVHWTLSVRSLSNSADYFSEFKVPVFRTPQSDPLYQADETGIKNFEIPVDFDQLYVNAGILQQSLDNGGLRFDFARCPYNPLATVLAGFQLVLSLVVVIALNHSGSATWPFVAGFLGLLMIRTLANLFLQHSRIDCTQGELEIRSGKLFLGSPRQISVRDVKNFEASERFSTTDNFLHRTRYYHLFVNLRDGARIRFAKCIFPQSVAFDIVRRLETRIGIGEEQGRGNTSRFQEGVQDPQRDFAGKLS